MTLTFRIGFSRSLESDIKNCRIEFTINYTGFVHIKNIILVIIIDIVSHTIKP